MIKLSIIVPIYNVELYLRKCVDSLLAQDYFDYEIILVDDGSTDNCPTICDDYASKHNTSNITHQTCPIHVIHQANAGLSAARNSGIKIANGEYIMFVDSDDYIEPNVLAGLIAQIDRDKLDVLRYRLQYVNPQYEVYNPYKSDPFEGNDYTEIPTDGVSFLNSRMNTQCYVWQFILKRNLLEDCLFTPGIYFEDTDWTPRMLCKARRVASMKKIVYNYLVREGSITNAVSRCKQKKVLNDKMHLIGEMQGQAKYLEQKGLSNVWFNRMIADTVISIIGMLSVEFYSEKDSYLNRLSELNIYPIHSCKWKARFINFSPRLVIELLHIKNK